MTREIKIIQEYIDRLELNLSGLTILTEEATGHYQWSSVIALMAGAKTVISIDNNHISDRVKDKIDIFLNLGHVRPIDKKLLRHATDKAVVAYMCESWEWREGDVDKYACRRMGIPIVGVNERFGDFEVFQSCGLLLLKILFDIGQEIAGCKYLVIGDDQFSGIAAEALEDNHADYRVFQDARKITRQDTLNVDAIIIADYGFKGALPSLISNSVYPPIIDFVSNNRMPKTLAYLGARPVIGLHCLGMKAAEVVYKGEQDGKYKDLIQVIK